MSPNHARFGPFGPSRRVVTARTKDNNNFGRRRSLTCFSATSDDVSNHLIKSLRQINSSHAGYETMKEMMLHHRHWLSATLITFCTQLKRKSKHWHRQLYGARVPSTSNCLIFLVSSEPHKLWHSTSCGCISSKNIPAYSFVTACLLHEFHNIFVCRPFS